MRVTGSLAGLSMTVFLVLGTVSFAETHYSLNEPDVPFPPARPTPQNLAAICHRGHGRPRYPASFFPASGASHFRRRGSAINRLETWYTLCCGGRVARQSRQILCCAQQAWKQALSQFCVEEYGTMTVAYECCEDRGDARWACFSGEAPNPQYSPKPGYTAPRMPQESGFTFDANTCI